MDNNNQEIKIKSVEPKIFSLVLRHDKGSYLHTNIHYSLEEAYRDARIEMETAVPEIIGTNVSLDMWNTVTVDQIRNGLFGVGKTITAVSDTPKKVNVEMTPNGLTKNAIYKMLKNKEKNEMIKSVIADPTQLEKLKGKLTKEDIMFIKDKLKNK